MMDLDDGLLVALAGRYEIEREIGQGGMAIIYLARDVKLNRRVALKVLRPELANSLGSERFLQEIAIAAPLVHPNILAIHDSGEAAGYLYYVMPYVDGPTLRQRLDRELQLPIDEAVGIVRQVAAALDFAHSRGVVHRDIKPENILLLDTHVLVADFGLAKAISRAASVPLTDHGIVVGTPAYMSPEQAVPDTVVDARSDIYSLACVTFEMIAGMVPFRGATAQAVLAHHVTSPPPALSEERTSCPLYLDEAVRRAMAKVPADRYSSARLYVRALESPSVTPSSPAFGATALPGARGGRGVWRRTLLVGGAVLALGAVGAMVWARMRGPLRDKPPLDRSTYAVFPFRHVGRVDNALLDGDGCARMLYDQMGHWQGIHLVDRMRVGDLWTRHEPRTVAEALDAAESLNAGVLAWGEVVPAGDSLEIRAVAYDVATRENPSRPFVIHVAADPSSLDSGFAMLASSIIVGGTREPGSSTSGTKNLRAFRQYNAGRMALDRFDLHEAERQFRDAAATDESYPEAHLWLARTLSWGGDAPPSSWTGDATRAVALSGALSSREAKHAAALLNLAEGNMRDACRRYRALIASDSLDFAAWFGLGDCNARDSIVVRDPRSPSGYAFRGSVFTAIGAYRRALSLVPSFHLAERGSAFNRLSRRVLYTEESRVRRGAALPPDTAAFVAPPSFAADTVAFVPVPYRVPRRTLPLPSERQAVMWSARVYQELMADWVRSFPASGEAQSGYAAALESSSAISGSSGELGDALAAARRAVNASPSVDARTARTATVVRLLVKMDSLASARVLVDSALRGWASADAFQAGYLAGMAALTGRARLGAALAARAAADTEHLPFVTSAGRRANYPNPVSASALELRMYASLGGPRDSLRAVFLRANRQIDTWIPPASRGDARQSLFRNAFALSYDPLALMAPFTLQAGPDQLLAMQEALARHDTSAVRAISRDFSALTSRFLPGSMGTDRLFHHAEILLALGDTAAAVGQLDAALGALPRVRSILLELPPQAGAVARTMILRARLAGRTGDRATAERWARSAETLWSDADPEMRAMLTEMRRQLSAPS